MATQTIKLTTTPQSLGSGVKTITPHGYNGRWAIGSTAPSTRTVVGHMMEPEKNLSLDADTDNVYVWIDPDAGAGQTFLLSYT